VGWGQGVQVSPQAAALAMPECLRFGQEATVAFIPVPCGLRRGG
jgi:hypothetical protein